MKIIYIFIFSILFQVITEAQTCNGGTPVTVTYDISTFVADGALNDPANTTGQICGFPPNGNIVGLQWNNVDAITDQRARCNHLAFSLNGMVTFRPFANETTGGNCTASTGGTISNLQDGGFTLTANAAGCISIQSYLSPNNDPGIAELFSGTLTFTACPEGIPLPIDLKSFVLENLGHENILKWETVAEINAEKFVIQRSDNGVANWEDLGSVKSLGTGNGLKSYQFLDSYPLINNYYRLKTIDLNGASEYSKIIFTNNVKNVKGEISVYPNPTKSEITLEGGSFNGKKQASVYNAAGLAVYEFLYDGKKETLDLSEFPAGMYFIHVQKDSGNQIKKIIKN